MLQYLRRQVVTVDGESTEIHVEPVTPPHIVFATFTFKDEDMKQEFLQMLESPDGLEVSRSSKGCRLFECLESQEDPKTIVIRQEWDSQADHEAYFEKRVASGMVEKLSSMLEGDIDIKRFSKLAY